MKTISWLLAGSALLFLPMEGYAEPKPGTFLDGATVSTGTILAISYPYSDGTIQIGFRGTALLPNAGGEAKVKSRQDVVTINAKFQNLEPATRFGPEYMTYVLWAISPAGKATNLGELILKNGGSRLTATTPLQTFGLIVTAEPDFAVTRVSDVVVLENVATEETGREVEQVQAQYELRPRGQYAPEKSSTELPPIMNKDIPPSVGQARNAGRIARLARANVYAPDEFNKAEGLLQQIEQESDKQKDSVVSMARQITQLYESARLIALKKQEDEKVTSEQEAAARKLLQTKEEAEAVRAAALEGTQKAQQVAQLVETAPETGLAETKKTQQETQAAEAARAAALADAQKAAQEAQTAEIARDAAVLEAKKAQQNAVELDQASQKQGSQKTDLLNKLKNHLEKIYETQESAQGLVVNIPGVLFDPGKSQLKGPDREKLATIAGILLSTPGLKVRIEGHTDNVGSDEFNQALSEQRAVSVMNYLVKQGLSNNSITAHGFGKTQPIASNDTRENRQKNRRIELLISEDETAGQTSPAGKS